MNTKANKPMKTMKAKKPMNTMKANKPKKTMKAKKPMKTMKAKKPMKKINAKKPMRTMIKKDKDPVGLSWARSVGLYKNERYREFEMMTVHVLNTDGDEISQLIYDSKSTLGGCLAWICVSILQLWFCEVVVIFSHRPCQALSTLALSPAVI